VPRAAFRSIGAHSTEGEVRVERGGGGEGEGEEVVLNNNLAVADRMLPDQGPEDELAGRAGPPAL